MKYLWAIILLITEVMAIIRQRSARDAVEKENDADISENVKRAQGALNRLDGAERDRLRDKYKAK